MENLNIDRLETLDGLEKISGHGDPLSDVFWEIVNFLVDYYPTYVDNGCPAVYNSGCNSIGMGLSGNTAFTGY